MLSLKDRILLLQSSTKSEKAVKLCKDASVVCGNALLESTISGQLLDNLNSEANDPAVRQFITRETKLNQVNDLGVKKSYSALCNSELVHYPMVRPVLERMRISIQTMPEYAIAESYVQQLDSFSWCEQARKDAKAIREKIEEHKDDIYLCNFLRESQNSYLLPAFKAELDNYFVNRDTESRNALVEKIKPYTLADPRIMELSNKLQESAGGLQVKADGSVKISKIYSPVHIEKDSQVFFNGGRFFTKNEEGISVMNEEEVKNLPQSFITLCQCINADNVRLDEQKIEVFTKTKVVTICPETKEFKVNGKDVDYNVFTRSFVNEGFLYGSIVNAQLNQISCIYENADSICDIEFGKHLESNTYKGHCADIYRFGNIISVFETNEMFKTSKMYNAITATQARELLIEHLNYDIKDTFCDLSTKEHEKVKQYESEKEVFEKNLEHLKAKKKQLLEAIEMDVYLQGSSEISELLESIDTEIERLQSEILTRTNLIKSITSSSAASMFEDEDFELEVVDNEDGEDTIVTVDDNDDDDDDIDDEDECPDGNCPDGEPQTLQAGDEVQLKNGALGVVQGYEEAGENCIILMHDGKTISVGKEFINEITVIKPKSTENAPEVTTDEIDDTDTEVVKESNTNKAEKAVCPVCGNDPCVCNKMKVDKLKKEQDPTPNTLKVDDLTKIPPQGTTPTQNVVVDTVQPTIAQGKVKAQLVDDQDNIVMDEIYVDADAFTAASDMDKIQYMTSTNSHDVFTTAKKYVKMLV